MIDFANSCVRTKTQLDINKVYIKNIKHSLDKVFIPYFHKKLDISFRDMLKRQHKQIVNNTYAGYTNPINKLPKSLIRDEADVKLHNPLLKKEWYKEELKKIKPSINDTIKIEIKGIPKEMWHYIENTNEGLKLYLPSKKYIKYYLNNMKKIMNSFRNGKKSLDLLGYYIQLGVICHPFKKVNFSLLMSQINYILKVWGYTPINHGYLDFECFLNSTNDIIKNFKTKIKKGESKDE